MKAGSSATRRRRAAARRLRAMMRRERNCWAEGLERVAGVDEAGVGPLAGPVVAAAVYFAPGGGVRGVDDSKRLGERRRDALAEEIRAVAAGFCVAVVDPEEIDRLNIYRAGLEAMRRAVGGLPDRPDQVLVDARTIPSLGLPQEAIVRGDSKVHAIAAASILAKVERDRLMRDYDARFPGYGFASHKGYPTVDHRNAIRRLGPCEIHRRSFTLLPRPRLFD